MIPDSLSFSNEHVRKGESLRILNDQQESEMQPVTNISTDHKVRSKSPACYNRRIKENKLIHREFIMVKHAINNETSIGDQSELPGITRRKFLETVIGAASFITVGNLLSGCSDKSDYTESADETPPDTTGGQADINSSGQEVTSSNEVLKNGGKYQLVEGDYNNGDKLHISTNEKTGLTNGIVGSDGELDQNSKCLIDIDNSIIWDYNILGNNRMKTDGSPIVSNGETYYVPEWGAYLEVSPDGDTVTMWTDGEKGATTLIQSQTNEEGKYPVRGVWEKYSELD